MVERVTAALTSYRLEAVHEDEARAAIAAMREPSEGMLRQGGYMTDEDEEAATGRAQMVWSMMIDTALNERPEAE